MSLTNESVQCSECTKCGLCKTRNHVVYGVGNESSPILLVGEGPGMQEDLQGIPFVGAAGQLLDDILSIIDLDRNNIYIANIVKCRPPGNRDPEPCEIQACLPWLQAQIQAISPKIIVCLGRISAGTLIHEDFRITKEHGKWFEKNGIFYTAVYHPSALLRDYTKRPDTFRDFLQIRSKIHELCPDFYESKE